MNAMARRILLVGLLGMCVGALACVSEPAPVFESDTVRRRDATASSDASLQDAVVADAGRRDSSTADIRPRVVAIGRNGELSIRTLEAPWASVMELRFGTAFVRTRAFGRVLYALMQSPTPSLRRIWNDGSIQNTIALPGISKPTDILVLDAKRALVTSSGNGNPLWLLQLDTGALQPVSLAYLSDPDGNPDANTMAICGSRAFVQLRREDHATGRAARPVLAVIDVSSAVPSVLDADAVKSGVQGVELHGTPDLDMSMHCTEQRLFVVEPALLMLDGGQVEEVNLTTLSASVSSLPKDGMVGALQMVHPAQGVGWMVMHTEFGPAPSSHLIYLGADHAMHGRWDTFAPEHIDHLALDISGSQLFFPHGCVRDCGGVPAGLTVFNAVTGATRTQSPIPTAFSPVDVVLLQ